MHSDAPTGEDGYDPDHLTDQAEDIHVHLAKRTEKILPEILPKNCQRKSRCRVKNPQMPQTPFLSKPKKLPSLLTEAVTALNPLNFEHRVPQG